MKSRVWNAMNLMVAVGFGFTLNLLSCSKLSAPSDEIAINVIIETNNRANFENGISGYKMSNATIMERGTRKESGSYPFKIKYTETAYNYKGQVVSQRENIEVYCVNKKQDDMGKYDWSLASCN
jgi:hypothetical protein